MNITPTVTWLELGWVALSLYIGFDAVRWLSANQGPRPEDPAERQAHRFIMTIGWYGLVKATLNSIAGVAAMTVGSGTTNAPVPIASMVAQAALIAALVTLKTFMAIIAQYQTNLVAYFQRQAAESAKSADDLERLEKITDSAVEGLEDLANAHLAKEGKKPFTAIAPVTPEHQSPVTASQQHDALYRTLKARVTAARLLLDLPLMNDNGGEK